jgi:hypothetical protein
MKASAFKSIAVFTAFLLMSVLLMQFVWRVSVPEEKRSTLPEEKINLALRRTAHLLLKESGDSTSRIPPVVKAGDRAWQVRLEQPFVYDLLAYHLDTSLKAHGIDVPYDVVLLTCEEGELALGYSHPAGTENGDIPCGGRDMPAVCFNLKVTFAEPAPAEKNAMPVAGWLFSSVLSLALFGLWQYRHRHTANVAPATPPANGGHVFGNSAFDAANLRLTSGGVSRQLTYREAKLLNLFLQHPNQVLERSYILENVWADEGILVGRSVDMFVSRLRKLLRDDPAVQFTAVHGVGYRMDVV